MKALYHGVHGLFKALPRLFTAEFCEFTRLRKRNSIISFCTIGSKRAPCQVESIPHHFILVDWFIATWLSVFAGLGVFDFITTQPSVALKLLGAASLRNGSHLLTGLSSDSSNSSEAAVSSCFKLFQVVPSVVTCCSVLLHVVLVFAARC